MATPQSLATAQATEARWWGAYRSSIAGNVTADVRVVTLAEAVSTTAARERIEVALLSRAPGIPAPFTVEVTGRIDDLHLISTPERLAQHIAEVFEGDPFPPSTPNIFVPLNLPAGVYQVTGIEGKFFDGFVPGRRLVTNSTVLVQGKVEGGWVDDPSNDQSWPLVVTPNMSAFDLMEAVSKSEANGYPDSNHVWFEDISIDPHYKLIDFSMGS